MATFFDGPKPRLFAHRGASGEAPENTLAAFQRAVDAGVEYIELDVHASEDGQIMVIHDATIERTTNGLGAVQNYSLAALQQLDAGYRFSPDEGKTLPFRASDVIIPSLQEVLESFPQVKFTVEIKPSDPPIEEPVIAVTKDCGKADEVIIASEHDAVLARVRTLARSFRRIGYSECRFLSAACNRSVGRLSAARSGASDSAHLSEYSVSDGTDDCRRASTQRGNPCVDD